MVGANYETEPVRFPQTSILKLPDPKAQCELL